jgi:hypothetical protein
MSQLSPERRKVVVIAASIAAMSGSVGLLARNHPWLAGVWLGLLAVALVYVMVQLVKIKRSRRQR